VGITAGSRGEVPEESPLTRHNNSNRINNNNNDNNIKISQTAKSATTSIHTRIAVNLPNGGLGTSL
jgi:hypothetical protein